MPLTLLEHLRTRSQVDSDTLDQEVVSSLAPFVDCTSNQAIAYLELAHTRHADLLKKALSFARELSSSYPEVSEATLAVDIAVRLIIST